MNVQWSIWRWDGIRDNSLLCTTSPHIIGYTAHHIGVSLVTQSVKNLPVVQETWVQSQGQEDPLEKEMATHSSILAWKILWTEKPGGLQSMGLEELDPAEQLNHHHSISTNQENTSAVIYTRKFPECPPRG